MERPLEKISDAELEVMRVLWKAGEALPVSGIRRALCEKNGWESSTVKTLVQRLHAKGALRQEEREVYYYTPLVTREEYGRYATKRLIDKLYHGSAKSLVAALVDSGLSESDVAELRAMLRKEGKNA
ncbi:MAG TPA: BlaI/MecI/CopY family transcriptional regulator [Oscillospiraceae bacterium]|nr:BlaI/MecI/CopY family transcriptional regulator [Oscillospiraceae bacterium]